MSLTEFFQKIVVKDTEKDTVSTEVPKVILSDKASLKDLVSKMVNQVQPTPTEPISLPIPANVTTVLQDLPETIPEAEVISPKNPEVAEITDPAHIIDESYPETVQIEKETETIANNVETVSNQTKESLEVKVAQLSEFDLGRGLVQKTLSEFNSLLVLGTDLEKAMLFQTENRELNAKRRKALEQAKAARTEVARKISEMFSVDSDSELTDEVVGQKLNLAIGAYEAYSDAAEEMTKALYNNENTSSNIAIANINAKKSQIKLLTEKLGGTRIFSEIKKTIITCEKIAKEALSQYEGVSKETIQKITGAVIAKVIEDPEGTKLLAQHGDIIEMMRHIFTNQPYIKDVITSVANSSKK